MYFRNSLLTAFGLAAFLTAGVALADTSSSSTSVPSGASAMSRFKPLAGSSASSSGTLHLTFDLNSSKSAALEAFVADLYNPLSPNYRHWLTPAQFGAKFGATDDDIAAVTSWAQSQGMTVTKVWPNRRSISVVTDVATAQKSFNVKIKLFQPNSRRTTTIYGPDKDPQAPASIASRIKFIGGLTNALQPEHRPITGIIGSSSTQPYPNTVTTVTNPFTPSQVSQLYDLSPLLSAGYTGGGIGIAVYEPTRYHETDITTFESFFGISASSITETWPSSTGRATSYSGSDEAALDIETIIGQVPNANVVVYEGPDDSTSPEDEFNQIAADDLPIASFSWSFPEQPGFSSTFNALNDIIIQMATQGMTVFAAGGDDGPYANGGSTPEVNFPASSPYAVGVGGTSVFTTNNGFWNSEVAWQDTQAADGDTNGTGGGVSIYFNQPSWQTGAGVSNSFSNGMRQVPDISAVAGAPGLKIYENGNWTAIGGTSASCPLWAASFLSVEHALGGSALGNIDPEIYSLASDSPTYAAVFHDITSGSNARFSATTGWDYMTGWGSVDFDQLYTNLAGTTGAYTYSSGLQMISVPYTYSGSEAGIFSTAPTLAAYDPTNGYDVFALGTSGVTSPGYGYWVRNTQPNTLMSAGTPVSASGAYSITLGKGWNIIGTPFTTTQAVSGLQFSVGGGSPVSFSSAVASGIINGALWTYSSGAGKYTQLGSSNNLVPYVGYWIDTSEACTLTFPPAG